MAKHRSRAKRNPHGTILVNPRKGGKSRRARSKPSKRAVSLAGLFAKSNPRKRRAHKRHARRNPLVVNPRKRRSHKRHARHARRNPLVVNPRKRRAKSRRMRRNPLVVNPRKRRARRNPLVMSNPVKGILGKLQAMVRKLPLVGGVLSTAVGGLGGAAAGAVAVLPIDMAMPYMARHIPDMLKPYAFTLSGLLMSGLVRALPISLPYKNELAVGLTFAGGAVDAYRYRRGTSGTLSGDGMGDDYGNADMGDLGDFGNDGSPCAAVEYAGASLADAEYGAADLSGEELAAAELGRSNYYRRFRMHRARKEHRAPGEASEYAAQPGMQWAWLIYWIGFENFQKLASYPEDRRRAIIEEFRRDAKLNSRKLLSQSSDNTVSDAETAGLLAVA